MRREQGGESREERAERRAEVEDLWSVRAGEWERRRVEEQERLRAGGWKKRFEEY